MLSFREAIRVVLENLFPLQPVWKPLEEALGQVLAEAVYSRVELPPADNSAMDGYAFAFTEQRAGDFLAVDGFLPAGALRSIPVPPGRAIKIMTGAPLPPCCDTVVPVEEVVVDQGGIRLRQSPRFGQYVRLKGEEARCGKQLLAEGTALHPEELGLLASGGIDRLKVYPAPRVALLSTGDELVGLGDKPGPGQIVNSNYYVLAARLQEEGCVHVPLGIARDDEEDLAARIEQGLQADILISTGGVSMGDRDLVQKVLRRLGLQLKFWKVSIKPGKPVLFGTIRDKPVFGLPGNPAASAATFELFVRPALRRMAGHMRVLPPLLRVILRREVLGGEVRQRFLWGALEEHQGRYYFTPSGNQNSSQNSGMQGSQALLPVAGGSPGLAAGCEVDVLLLRLPPGQADSQLDARVGTWGTACDLHIHRAAG